MDTTPLSRFVSPAYLQFIALVRKCLGTDGDGLELTVYPERGYTLSVAEVGQHPFAFVDANLQGGAREVSETIRAALRRREGQAA